MCEYLQREYACGHFRWISTAWCIAYMRRKKCEPYLDREVEVCGECKSKNRHPPWEHLIGHILNRPRN
ncbi:hypothetical protein QBC46DRAFT_342250 [Diplogelasinospora grovesii]|uniref:Uncharacterized protein n=1 Tax=Diplogelasinospora grovesii TaxID=303347 RepID=A0AAN6S445_9PEZI|nr:hypothetical protein QBC46DRAFT_342250 [Diplogelasinospora grovesii]